MTETRTLAEMTTDELRRYPTTKLWHCAQGCGEWYSHAGPGPEPACPYCAMQEALEPIRDLLRHLSSAPTFLRGEKAHPLGYSVYRNVWAAGRDALTKLERLARVPATDGVSSYDPNTDGNPES